MPKNAEALDLLSTSQTTPRICPFGAPFVAEIRGDKRRIFQSCCNHWECPTCGNTRAKQEYARIVHGAEVLSIDRKLYFWTTTCRGRELALDDAMENYGAWTNVLLTNARTKAKREGLYWAYSQVTERQKKTRKHPHSHIITTFLPSDAIQTHDENGRNSYSSRWFSVANASAGLGPQHRITEVVSAAAVSRYVAKYMFKDAMQETWPPKWKRVRYSQNWPKLPLRPADLSIVLRASEDWSRAAAEPVVWETDNEVIYGMAQHRIWNVRMLASY